MQNNNYHPGALSVLVAAVATEHDAPFNLVNLHTKLVGWHDLGAGGLPEPPWQGLGWACPGHQTLRFLKF